MFTAYRNVWFWVAVILIVPALWALWINYPVQMGAIHLGVGCVALWFGFTDSWLYIEQHLIGDMDDGTFKNRIWWAFNAAVICTCITSIIVLVYSVFALLTGDALFLFR